MSLERRRARRLERRRERRRERCLLLRFLPPAASGAVCRQSPDGPTRRGPSFDGAYPPTRSLRRGPLPDESILQRGPLDQKIDVVRKNASVSGLGARIKEFSGIEALLTI